MLQHLVSLQPCGNINNYTHIEMKQRMGLQNTSHVANATYPILGMKHFLS